MPLGNEPAYPVTGNIIAEEKYKGETIRQKFVRAAMQGLITAVYAIDSIGWTLRDFAEETIKIADACLRLEAETRGSDEK